MSDEPLTGYHFHEAVDRAFLCSQVFDEFLLKHPVVERTPELKQAAERISDLLGEFYQSCARASYAFSEEAPDA